MTTTDHLIAALHKILDDPAVPDLRKREYKKMLTAAKRLAKPPRQSRPVGRPRRHNHDAIRKLLAQGKSSAEVEATLGVSPATVSRAKRNFRNSRTST